MLDKKIFNQHRNEIYELVNDLGGRIDFVEGIINDGEDKFNVTLNEDELPFAAPINDNVVLAIRCGEEEGIVEFLGYNIKNHSCTGWHHYTDFYENDEDEWLLWTSVNLLLINHNLDFLCGK